MSLTSWRSVSLELVSHQNVGAKWSSPSRQKRLYETGKVTQAARLLFGHDMLPDDHKLSGVVKQDGDTGDMLVLNVLFEPDKQVALKIVTDMFAPPVDIQVLNSTTVMALKVSSTGNGRNESERYRHKSAAASKLARRSLQRQGEQTCSRSRFFRVIL